MAKSHPQQAEKIGGWSFSFSSCGMCTAGLNLILVIYVVLFFTADWPRKCGDKYMHRSYVGYSGSCYFLSGAMLCKDGYCYTNNCTVGVVYSQGCYVYKIYVGKLNECTGIGVKLPDGYCYYPDCPYYRYGHTCYRNKTYVGSSGNCTGDISPSGYCYYTYCPSIKFPTECYKYKTRHFESWNTSRCAVIANDYYVNNTVCYSTSCDNYEYRGSCYMNRDYVGNSSSCIHGVTSLSGYCYINCPEYLHYYDGFCYNNKMYLYVNSTDNCTGVTSPDDYCYFDWFIFKYLECCYKRQG